MEFLNSHSLKTFKTKFIILYLLNITDVIFTILLLQTGYYREINYLMIKAVSNPPIAITIKTIIPATLLIYIYIRIKNATLNQLKKSNILVNVVLIFYGAINYLHIFFFLLVPVFNSL